ncbi:MAG: NAD(P)-dependent oxidoreductase [Gaiellales bacterium]
MNVGFVGLGSLGSKLAGCILRAGLPLTVTDLSEAAAASLVADGARWGGSAADVSREADVVITCLPSPAVSAQVVAGDDGVFGTLRPGATWIEMSTTDKHEVRRLAALGDERGIQTLEAPVTGGVHLAATGAVTVIVGGDAVVFDRHRALLEAMGRRLFHVGPLGSASDLKVVTNMLAFIHLVACGEALALSAEAGLDLRQSWEVIAASSGTSFVHETEGQLILSGSYDIGFTIDLALKDLGLALSLGEETGVPLELATLTSRAFEVARERFGGGAQSPRVVQLLEEQIGRELRAPGFPAQLGE